jgi:hypothetical protein
MTVHDIIAKLFVPLDKARIEKAKGLASRQKIEWQLVLDAMTPEQRKQVQDATSAE